MHTNTRTVDNEAPTAEQQLQAINDYFTEFIDADTQLDIRATFDKPLVERIRIVLKEFDQRTVITAKEREDFEDQLNEGDKDYEELEDEKEALESKLEATEGENATLRETITELEVELARLKNA